MDVTLHIADSRQFIGNWGCQFASQVFDLLDTRFDCPLQPLGFGGGRFGEALQTEQVWQTLFPPLHDKKGTVRGRGLSKKQ